MNIGLEVKVTKNEFTSIGARTRALLFAVLRKAALDIEAHAKANAPVDLGALRASIFVITKRSNTFTLATAEAKAKNPDAQLIAEPKLLSDMEAVVAVGVMYGVYVNFGTIRMAANPFFSRAVETVRPQFLKAVAAAIRKGAGQ